MRDKTWSIEVVPINGPEDMREPTRGLDVETVQLKPGKLRGSITHLGIGNLGISLGRFDSEIRIRGALRQDRVVLGTIMDSAGRVTQWWQDVLPGDVCVFPAGVEFDSIHSGCERYLAVSLGFSELSLMLGGENGLADPAFWNTKGLYHPDPRTGEAIRRRLKEIMFNVERKTTAPTAQAADFLQRSIIEAFVLSLTSAPPTEKHGSFYTGARLVSEAENYVDSAGGRPVHISEICSALKVSRRSLHRAFSEMLGVGPVAYLRRRRLSAIRSVLRRSDPATISIGDVAFENGFPEPGRFAAYYRAHFGETPSETFRSWSARRQVRPQDSSQ
jgi:AraC family ethanolamine operon transcriptional activator